MCVALVAAVSLLAALAHGLLLAPSIWQPHMAMSCISFFPLCLPYVLYSLKAGVRLRTAANPARGARVQTMWQLQLCIRSQWVKKRLRWTQWKHVLQCKRRRAGRRKTVTFMLA